MNRGDYVSKSEALERIGKRNCKGKGKHYTSGYMAGLETAKRVVEAMPEADAVEVKYTTLVRGYVHGSPGVFQWGCCGAYVDKRLVGWCKRCKCENLVNARYCNNCGAVVDCVEEEEEE